MNPLSTSDTKAMVEAGYIGLYVYRFLRQTLFRLLAVFDSKWNQVAQLTQQLDCLTDRGTLNRQLYADPAFERSIRELEGAIRVIKKKRRRTQP